MHVAGRERMHRRNKTLAIVMLDADDEMRFVVIVRVDAAIVWIWKKTSL